MENKVSMYLFFSTIQILFERKEYSDIFFPKKTKYSYEMSKDIWRRDIFLSTLHCWLLNIPCFSYIPRKGRMPWRVISYDLFHLRKQGQLRGYRITGKYVGGKSSEAILEQQHKPKDINSLPKKMTKHFEN